MSLTSYRAAPPRDGLFAGVPLQPGFLAFCPLMRTGLLHPATVCLQVFRCSPVLFQFIRPRRRCLLRADGAAPPRARVIGIVVRGYLLWFSLAVTYSPTS
jgi:hypothetical protein